LFTAVLALLTVSSPLRAQDAGLKNGAASLAAGKYDAAVRQLSATINADNASPSDAARALYLRGIAYRKMGEPARAVADLGAAIWLGLPQDDKIKALVNRGLAYKAAGLGKEAEAELAAARSIGGSSAVDNLIAEGGGAPAGAAAIAAFATEVTPGDGGAATATGRPRLEPVPDFSTSVSGGAPPPSEPPPTRTANAAPGSWSTSVADEAQPASNAGGGNRLTRWFGSLTDSSSESPGPAPVPAPAPAQAAPPPKPSAPPEAAASSSWSTSTEAEQAAPSGGGESGSRWSRLWGRTAEADPTAQPAPAAAPSSGGAYRLQLATSRSEAEAQALWKTVSKNQGLGGVGHDIERVEIGSFGTFYALRIGPFPDKAESLKVCNALKRTGIDCSLAEQ
jgi:tetratricopeptide (TPR) repeat protein